MVGRSHVSLVSREVRIAEARRGRTQSGERPMGAAAGGNGSKERARVSGKGPIGAASRRQQCNQASCQPPQRHGPATMDLAHQTRTSFEAFQTHIPRAGLAAARDRPLLTCTNTALGFTSANFSC